MLEQKLSEANWIHEKENDSGFTEEEMQVFNRILNEISSGRADYFVNPQDELKFYEGERKQYLTHTRKKM